MKTIIATLALRLSVFLLFGLITAEGRAQSTSATTTTNYLPTSTMVGSRVTDPQGAEIGQIGNVVLDRETGCMAYVVLSTTESGGTGRSVAVPWSILAPGSDERTYQVTVDREKLESAPVWESSRIDEYSRPEWVRHVYSYYGVQPGAHMTVHAGLGVQGEPPRRVSEQAHMENGAASERHHPVRNNDMLMHRGRNDVMNSPGENPAPGDVPHDAVATATPLSNPGDKPHQAASVPPSPSPTRSRDRAARRERRHEERAHPSASPDSSAAERRPARHKRAGESVPKASPTP